MNVLESFYVKSNSGAMVFAPGFPEHAYAALAAVLNLGDEHTTEIILAELER